MKRRGRGSPDDARAQIARLERRVQRERQARIEAESIAEQTTRDLFFSVERLEQLNEELRRANDVRERIVQTTAERMVLPMASVNQLSSSLERRWEQITDRNRRMYVGMINEQSTRASRYVQDLVVISQLGTDGLEPDLVTIPLRSTLASILERVVPADFPVELAARDDIAVRADDVHLNRILTALVQNAVRHGEAPLHVSVSPAAERVSVVVRDHGSGIPADHHDELFEPFSVSQTLAPADEPRAGMGLAVARHLAELQGGSLTYAPADPGSCFTLELPVAR